MRCPLESPIVDTFCGCVGKLRPKRNESHVPSPQLLHKMHHKAKHRQFKKDRAQPIICQIKEGMKSRSTRLNRLPRCHPRRARPLKTPRTSRWWRSALLLRAALLPPRSSCKKSSSPSRTARAQDWTWHGICRCATGTRRLETSRARPPRRSQSRSHLRSPVKKCEDAHL